MAKSASSDALLKDQRSDALGSPAGPLARYRSKRNFARTPEPVGGHRHRAPTHSKQRALTFVVHKHAAGHLHYDFRLELDGVLLSWAVPKGPSLDSSVRRLAVETEPHPLDYGNFEGTIPEGEYGGGTVMLWDRGSWSPIGDPHRGYNKGHLAFTLDGEKLHGAWHLVRTAGAAAKNRGWLLFKSRDSFSRSGADVILIEAPDSAATGRTLEQIATCSGETLTKSAVGSAGKTAKTAAPKTAARIITNTADSETAPRIATKTAARRAAKRSASAGSDLRKLRGSVKSSLASVVEPQLATLVTTAPVGEEWVHETKYDGYRILARLWVTNVTATLNTTHLTCYT